MKDITCGYCGRSFAEDQGQPACSECPLRGGCRFVRCPHCGYENPCTPAWLDRVRGWLGADAARADRSDARTAHDVREEVERR